MGFFNSEYIKTFLVGRTITDVRHVNPRSDKQSYTFLDFDNGESLRLAGTMETFRCGCCQKCEHTERGPVVLATPYDANGVVKQSTAIMPSTNQKGVNDE